MRSQVLSLLSVLVLWGGASLQAADVGAPKLGAVVAFENGVAKVIAVLDGDYAAKAFGMQNGDILVYCAVGSGGKKTTFFMNKPDHVHRFVKDCRDLSEVLYFDASQQTYKTIEFPVGADGLVAPAYISTGNGWTVNRNFTVKSSRNK